jgi:ABC-2 type transport system permease protein
MSRHDDAPLTAAPALAGATGVIHDIGYQSYSGVRLGRRYAVRSLYVHSLRTAFGLGRSAKAKVLPVGILAVSCIAALVLVVVGTQLPQPVLTYVAVASTFSYGVTAFVAVVGPELVSRDLRNSLLPLYFSRPITRSDYALAKFAALTSAVFVVFASPMVIMFLGATFSPKAGFSGIVDDSGRLLLGLLAALIHSLVFAALALPLASLTGRRVFATGMIIAVFLLTSPISGVLAQISSGSLANLAGLFDPVSLLNGVDKWLFGDGLVDVGNYGPVYGLVAAALAALGVTLLLWRYRTVKA